MSAVEDRAKLRAIIAAWTPEQRAEVQAAVEWIAAFPPPKFAAAIRYLIAPEGDDEAFEAMVREIAREHASTEDGRAMPS